MTETKKRQDGSTYEAPVDLDFFRFTSDRPDVEQAFRAAYGDKPQLLDVYLPYPLPEENFQTCMEEWRGGGLVHRCDGEVMSIWLDAQGVYHTTEPRPCPYHGHPELRTKADKKKGTKANPGCLEVGRLNVILPGLLAAGYTEPVLLVTTAVNDIIPIMSALRAIAEEQERYQRSLGQESSVDLRGILWTLRRVPESISTPGDNGGRVHREKFLVRIAPAIEWTRAQLALAQRTALPEAPTTWQAQAPDWPDANHPDGVDEATTVDGEATEIPPETAAPGSAAAGEAAETPAAPVGTSAADWLGKYPKVIAACRAAHKYLTPSRIAERLSSLGVDPAAGPDVAIDALNAPPEQGELFQEEVAR